MPNYAKQLNYNPIKRSCPWGWGIKIMEVWEKRGYQLMDRISKLNTGYNKVDYYFIYKGV